MRLSYTDIKNSFYRNAGLDNSEDTAILADFKANLGTRYQMILAKMRDYMTQKTVTSTTVNNQQFYHYPPGVTNIESIVVTIGSVNYPTTIVNSQWQWDWLNALQVQPTAIPQFIFPRRDDFGIYPKPQAAYTITFNYHYRDRNLGVEDFTTGTATVTHASQAVTIAATDVLGVPIDTMTSAMVNRWFQITDPTEDGEGYWYRILDIPTARTITLESAYQGSGGTGYTYRVAQTPEFPEEGHIILVDGVTADFYSGVRHDITTATFFENKFWTGSGTNNSRDMGSNEILGGLIGLYNQYADRNSERIIDRKKKVYPFMDQNWGMQLS